MTLADVGPQAQAYLSVADRLLPGWVTGFYVIGSAALGEYVPGRSDLDFVAVVSAPLTRTRHARLRLVHAIAATRAGRVSKARGGSWTGETPNGVFVLESEVDRPVSEIRPLASHTGYRFARNRAFDVNPVTWKVLAERGLAVRGPEPSELRLDPEPAILRQWNLDNLAGYWRSWGKAMSRGRSKLSSQALRYSPAWAVGWGTLGAPRLHCTIATGEVIGKRGAGEYALRTFDEEWHSVIRLGLSWWERDRHTAVTAADLRRAGEFVLCVNDAARAL
jgi:predicted nucleotidyltransferase